MHNKITIGIDPGVKTGLAIFQGDLLIDLQTTDFWGAYDAVMDIEPERLHVIAIEVSGTTNVWHSAKFKGAGVAGKIGQNVGAVREQGELLAARFGALGLPVITSNPLGKVPHFHFNKLYPDVNRSNEHERDAAMLARLYCRAGL